MTIYSKTNPPNGFYTYAYLRTDGTPYYIGKGKKDRAWQDHRYKSRDSTYMMGVYTPENNRIVIMESMLTEIGAFALERRYIRWYGRKDNKTGILHNRTDGGDGVYGYVATEKTREKLSKANTGKKQSSEEIERKIQRQKGQKHTSERTEKRADAMRGRKVPLETLAKRKATLAVYNPQKGRKQEVVTCPHCTVSGGNRVMKRHHFDRCKNKPQSLM